MYRADHKAIDNKDIIMKYKGNIIAILSVFFLIPSLLFASSETQQVIKIGVIEGDTPISFFQNGRPDGIAYQIIENIFNSQNIKSIAYSIKNENDGFQKLSSGDIDILVGAIIPTADLNSRYDFSLPFTQSYVAVVTPKKEMVFSHLTQELHDTFFWYIMMYSLIGQLLFSFLLWMSEHRTHPDFTSRSVIKGIAFANWAIVSAFIRDLIFEPQTARGRFVMGIWLLCSVTFMTVLASSVTVSIIQLSAGKHSFIKNKTDLINLNIGLHSHAGLLKSLDLSKSKTTIYDTEEELFNALHEKKVDAIIDNAIMLDYYMTHHRNISAVKADLNLKSDYFSYVMRKDFPWKSMINTQLLLAQENKQTEKICERFVQKQQADCSL